jgi:hypothetical protein
MECESIAETVSVEDGVVQIAFDLAGSSAGYLVLSKPHDRESKDDFFGEDHHVEVRDQLYGRYGAIEALEIDHASQFHIRLKGAIPDVGRNLTIFSRSPMSDAIMKEVRTLERRGS